MGIFDIFKSKKVENNNNSRKEILARNDGLPFTTIIEDDKHSNEESLEYNYTDVECNIIGDSNDMISGAILYIERDGILKNVYKERILQIKSEKLRSMVNDFFDKDKFSTVRAKFVSCDDEKGLINIGFFVDYGEDIEYDDLDKDDEE